MSQKLLQATLTIKNFFNSTLCLGFDSKNYCAIDLSPKQSATCYGDSGGGMMFYLNERWYLYGITSFGSANRTTDECLKSYPSFFTIIPNYRKFYSQYLNK